MICDIVLMLEGCCRTLFVFSDNLIMMKGCQAVVCHRAMTVVIHTLPIDGLLSCLIPCDVSTFLSSSSTGRLSV